MKKSVILYATVTFICCSADGMFLENMFNLAGSKTNVGWRTLPEGYNFQTLIEKKAKKVENEFFNLITEEYEEYGRKKRRLKITDAEAAVKKLNEIENKSRTLGNVKTQMQNLVDFLQMNFEVLIALSTYTKYSKLDNEELPSINNLFYDGNKKYKKFFSKIEDLNDAKRFIDDLSDIEKGILRYGEKRWKYENNNLISSNWLDAFENTISSQLPDGKTFEEIRNNIINRKKKTLFGELKKIKQEYDIAIADIRIIDILKKTSSQLINENLVLPDESNAYVGSVKKIVLDLKEHMENIPDELQLMQDLVYQVMEQGMEQYRSAIGLAKNQIQQVKSQLDVMMAYYPIWSPDEKKTTVFDYCDAINNIERALRESTTGILFHWRDSIQTCVAQGVNPFIGETLADKVKTRDEIVRRLRNDLDTLFADLKKRAPKELAAYNKTVEDFTATEIRSMSKDEVARLISRHGFKGDSFRVKITTIEDVDWLRSIMRLSRYQIEQLRKSGAKEITDDFVVDVRKLINEQIELHNESTELEKQKEQLDRDEQKLENNHSEKQADFDKQLNILSNREKQLANLIKYSQISKIEYEEELSKIEKEKAEVKSNQESEKEKYLTDRDELNIRNTNYSEKGGQYTKKRKDNYDKQYLLLSKITPLAKSLLDKPLNYDKETEAIDEIFRKVNEKNGKMKRAIKNRQGGEQLGSGLAMLITDNQDLMKNPEFLKDITKELVKLIEPLKRCAASKLGEILKIRQHYEEEKVGQLEEALLHWELTGEDPEKHNKDSADYNKIKGDAIKQAIKSGDINTILILEKLAK